MLIRHAGLPAAGAELRLIGRRDLAPMLSGMPRSTFWDWARAAEQD
jgi:hypothetical protein